MISTRLKGKIVPTNQETTWLNARNVVKDMGGLPPHILHDEYSKLSSIELSLNNLPDNFRRVWARELLIYPEKNGQFKKGKDVVDAFKDNLGRNWVFPASLMPEQAIKRANVGLFVDPEQVEISEERVVILAQPDSIVVLDSFLQNSEWGKVDEATRIPLKVSEDIMDLLPETQKRNLYRIAGSGVRPLSRYYHLGEYVYASDYGTKNAVAYVIAEGSASRDVEVVRFDETAITTYRNMPAEINSPVIRVLGATLDDAEAEYRRLTPEIINSTQLIAIRRLLDSLAIKI